MGKGVPIRCLCLRPCHPVLLHDNTPNGPDLLSLRQGDTVSSPSSTLESHTLYAQDCFTNSEPAAARTVFTFSSARHYFSLTSALLSRTDPILDQRPRITSRRRLSPLLRPPSLPSTTISYSFSTMSGRSQPHSTTTSRLLHSVCSSLPPPPPCMQ